MVGGLSVQWPGKAFSAVLVLSALLLSQSGAEALRVVLLAPTSPASSSWLLSPHPVLPSFPPVWDLAAALLPKATAETTTALLVPAAESQPSAFPLCSNWSALGAMGQEERTRVLQPGCGGDPAAQLEALAGRTSCCCRPGSEGAVGVGSGRNLGNLRSVVIQQPRVG